MKRVLKKTQNITFYRNARRPGYPPAGGLPVSTPARRPSSSLLPHLTGCLMPIATPRLTPWGMAPSCQPQPGKTI